MATLLIFSTVPMSALADEAAAPVTVETVVEEAAPDTEPDAEPTATPEASIPFLRKNGRSVKITDFLGTP